MLKEWLKKHRRAAAFDTGNVSQQCRLFKRQSLVYFDGIEILDTLFKPDEQPSYNEIFEKFDEYCNPKKNTVFERSVYFCLAQKPEQPVDMFILELKKQATLLCEFPKEEHDKLLLDMLVIGIRDVKLREKLLRNSELDLTKAVEVCKCHERSQNKALQIVASSSATPLSVDQLNNKRRPSIGNSVPHCQNSAECDTLSEQSYRMLSPHPPLFPTTNVFKPYLAPVIHPLGKITVWCKSHRLDFFTMPDDEENLLGFKTCRCLDLIKRVSLINKFFTRDVFVEANNDLFNGVGKIPGKNKIYVSISKIESSS
ncbi:hypothetical protein V9T40_007019 [Parthenolecanium corni]|uniref:Retrotransposon gag domain-containing protein n=1 Tax=Parthenolecanium corni TaxID=536013 RepID=A0AAN9TXT0_9HEMI